MKDGNEEKYQKRVQLGARSFLISIVLINARGDKCKNPVYQLKS